MTRYLGAFAMMAPLLLSLAAAEPALAQRAGGVLKMFSPDSPASMSIHEESTVFADGAADDGVDPRHVRKGYLLRPVTVRQACGLFDLAAAAQSGRRYFSFN